MISIYEICKSYAKSFAQIESDCTFREGVSSLMASRIDTETSFFLARIVFYLFLYYYTFA